MKEIRQSLADSIQDSPLAQQVYFVGGCVRDKLLNRPTKDLDLVVESQGGAEKITQHIYSKLGKEKVSTPRQLGRGYPIWQIVFKESGIECEFADTQSEMFPNDGSRQRVSTFSDLPNDSKRRDFTVNMLYENVLTGKILDPSGEGLSDLKKKILRTRSDVQAEKIFSDDPLRMLRLFRFSAQLNWPIDPSLIPVCQKIKSRFSILSMERVRDEFHKTMLTGNFYKILPDLLKIGAIEIFLPELLPMKGCTQDPLYHSEGDVWLHTIKVVELSPPNPLLQWSALLHDVGKAPTRSVNGTRIQFINHEKVGGEISQQILHRFKIEKSLQEKIIKLILLHLRGGDVKIWKSLKPARKLLRDLDGLQDEFLDLVKADSGASLDAQGKTRMEHIPALIAAMEEVQKVPLTKKAIINGHELMEFLHIKPGPRVKEATQFLEDLQDEYAAQGKELGRDKALEELQKWAKL